MIIHPAPLAVFIVAFSLRITAIVLWPDAFQFDAYQRWAGRDHLFIQVWLPATQAIVWLSAKCGLDAYGLRFVFALLGSATLAMGAELAQQLAPKPEQRPHAGWFCLPLAGFGPYLVWSTSPYQESTMLFFFFGALLLWNTKPKIGDWIMGALALVRFEGWPIIIVYMALRKSWWALTAAWGMLLIGAIEIFELVQPYAASPDSFSDWNELNKNLKRKWKLLNRLRVIAEASGVLWLLASVALLFKLRPLKRTHWMILLMVLGQIAATIGWLLSLGVAFSRQMILIGIPCGLLTAAVLSVLWANLKPLWRIGVLLFVSGWTVWTLADAQYDYNIYARSIKAERPLIELLRRCPDETWSVVPRPHPGPRNRHDGCEVIQGLTPLRAGQEFNCETWGWGGPPATVQAVWIPGQRYYQIKAQSSFKNSCVLPRNTDQNSSSQ